MEENQLKLHQKQKQQQKSQNQLFDLKLSALNKLDESSCWSDSQRKKLSQSFSSFLDEKQQNQDDFNFKIEQQQIDILNKSESQSSTLQNSQHQNLNLMSTLKQQNDSISINNSQLNHIYFDSKIEYYKQAKKKSKETNNSQVFENYEKNQLCQKSTRIKEMLDQSAYREKLTRRNSMQRMKLLTKIKHKISYFYKKYTLNGRTSLLNYNIRAQIQDLSDGLYKTPSNYLQLLLANYLPSLEKLIQKCSLPIITNFSMVGLLIKIIFSSLNCLFLYFYSLFLVFCNDDQQLESIIRLIIPLWVIEILIKLNMYPEKTVYKIVQRKHLLVYYLKQQCFFDLIPLITSLISLQLNQNKFCFQIVVLIKVYNVLNNLSDIQKRLCMILKSHYIIQLIYLIMQLFFIGHIVSCLWRSFQSIESLYFSDDKNWQSDLSENDLIWWRNYIWYLYWSLTLMATGSNEVRTVSEAYFTCFIMLFTTIIFGYFLNAIGIILSEIDEKNLAVKNDLSIINQYMRKGNISKTLQQQVNFSLQNYYRKNYSKISEENNKILGKISQDLQKSVLKEQNMQILTKIQCLKNNFSQKSLEELSLRVKEEYYTPKQTIVDKDEQFDGSMFYIISGQIELIGSFYDQQCLQTPLKLLKKGDLTGEINFFTGLCQTPCIRSSGFTKILRIQRENFLEIAKSNEKDFELFCFIKDKINLSLDFSGIVYNYNCQICKKQCHFQMQCPLVSIDREPYQFQVTNSLNQKQKRFKFGRKNFKKVNSLNVMRDTQKFIKHFISNIKMQNQSVPTFQKLEANLFSEDEDEEIFRSQNNQSKLHESQEVIKTNSQEENYFQKSKFDQVQQTQLDSSIKIHRYLSSGKKQQSLNDLEQPEQSQILIGDFQRDQFKSFRSDLQSSYEQACNESQRTIKRQQDMIRKNSRDILQSPSEAEFQKKKSYMINYKKSSSNSRTNFNGQISIVDEQQYYQNENQSFMSAIKNNSNRIIKYEAINDHGISNQTYQNNYSKFLNITYNFERLQNYNYYQPQGNLKLQIFRYNRFIKKKIKNKKKLKLI